ncbi:MAG: TMEM175 family protein [Bacteroidota bacterium]|nr:TMEM175 family protein [Bacteroidota bacterium]
MLINGNNLNLLILGIKVPDLNNFASNEKLYQSLIKLWTSYFAFILSFVAVLIMWINHHGFFKYLKKSDIPFLYANGFLLLTVTFMNFPTAVLAKYFETPAFNIASAFYCGALVLINVAFNILWLTSAFKRKLVKDEPSMIEDYKHR